MESLFSLEKKHILLTGASGFLGETIAKGLIKAGAHVYLNGRDESKVTLLKNKLDLEGYIDCSLAVFDVTCEKSITNFFNCDCKKLDVIVNNAYSGQAGTIETSHESSFIDSYKVTVCSSQMIFQSALPLLRKSVKQTGQASVINIASMYGVVSPDISIYRSKEVSNPPFYGAAKAALIQWSKYAACEFAVEGIRVNTISPGPFPSDQAQGSDASLMHKIKEKSPSKRLGIPQELIGPVIFLASNASSYVTGANLMVDGGWTAW